MSVKTSEILVGRKAAKKLQSSIKSILAVETVKQTGELMKSTVRAVKERQTEELQRLVISQPHYGFKLNHGFTGAAFSLRLASRHLTLGTCH